MRVVFQMSAIVAALALAGCGQRGALYLPVVPPLPAKPTVETVPAPEDAASDASAASGAEPISASAGTTLQLSPSLAAPAPASAATPTR
ncbi:MULTISPECIES: LPS translocon maturation chaperone LptM [Burkholderia]|jgi:predicted small lipoprotein YifL|uniref:Lipoprotein n=2 Tax=Burkholderia gladioli TaxID=28095 RepID=A0AAP2JGZ9_BURGA|nr:MULTISPECIES: lipoprotein [Burkholderia]AEA59035.1 Lipoprotein, putative [Burkholderia gladioli BSR3]AJX00770.1 prokaryotic lipo-attachment site family protein [Burkholderia gladioli]ASD77847.1 hypothetical protein CEJ98_01715 [Burkholderia gladioli pv. gladioli]AWY53241.1 hypothetical protein A8H28_18315 [Burkholderia gladioli pv. gladioli]AYQ87073.1 hypothetical protein EDD84_06545 [Burkholderia gladioli]